MLSNHQTRTFGNSKQSVPGIPAQPGLISNMTGMHDDVLELGHQMTHELGHSGLSVYQN